MYNRAKQLITTQYKDPGFLLASLLLFSQLTLFWSKQLHKTPITLTIIFGLVWFFWRGKSFRKIYPVLSLFLVIFCAITTWALVNMTSSPPLSSSLRLDVLAKFFSFIPIGWILYKREKFLFPFIVATIAGTCATPFTSKEAFHKFFEFLTLLVTHPTMTDRYQFGFQNAEFTGMVYGFNILMLLFLWRRFFIRNGTLYLPTSILYVFLMLLSVIGLFASKTRAPFLGLLVVSVVFALLSIFKYWRNRRSSYVTLFAPILILFLASLSFFYVWQLRSSNEAATLTRIDSLNFSDIPKTSIGLRIYLIRTAFPAILERPLFGWGNEGSTTVINRSGLPQDVIDNTGHFHNTVLEISIRHGLIVLVIFASVYGWFLFKSRNAYTIGSMPPDFYSFFIAYLFYFFIVNQFESYLLYGIGDFVNHTVLAIALVYIFKAKEPHSGRGHAAPADS